VMHVRARGSLPVCSLSPFVEPALVSSFPSGFLFSERFPLCLSFPGSPNTNTHLHVQADKEALGAEKTSTKVTGAEEKKSETSETPLNPSYSCDAAVVRITKEFSFVFGPCPIHPYIAVSV